MFSARVWTAIALAGLLSAPAAALRVETLSGVRSNFSPAGVSSGEPLTVASGEALVQFAASEDYSERLTAVRSIGADIIQEFEPDHWTHVSLPPGMSVSEGLTRLGALAEVVKVKPNMTFKPVKLPSDPQVLNQYHLNKVNAFAAWEFDVGSSTDVTVVIMDTGVESTHAEFTGKISTTTSRVCSATDCNTNETAGKVACNHGTRVAGVAAALGDNGSGGAGLSWGAKIISLRVFDAAADGGGCNPDCSNVSGANTCETSETRIRRAVDHATTLAGTPGVNRIVVNMSIGGGCECGANQALPGVSADCSGFDSLLPASFTAAQAAGVLLVAAAGNYSGTSSGGPVQSPANCEHVIPVGATDENDSVAGFSARGSSLAAHGVVAPGVSILTADVGGGMASASGTSFASPVVAGIAALMLSADPTLTTTTVKNAIRNSAEGIGISSLGLASGVSGTTAGAGRVNAFKAMRLALGKGAFEGDQTAIGFPNPFRPSTHGTATFTIPSGLQGKSPKVRVYTMDGALVKDLGSLTTWDGRNSGGTSVASGVYIFTVETTQGMEKGRIAVIR